MPESVVVHVNGRVRRMGLAKFVGRLLHSQRVAFRIVRFDYRLDDGPWMPLPMKSR